MGSKSTWDYSFPLSHLSVNAWEGAREKLSQLLEDEVKFVDFAKYYENLKVAESLRLNGALKEDDRRDQVYDLEAARIGHG